MDIQTEFAREWVSYKHNGEPKGAALLSTELTPRDIVMARMILRSPLYPESIERSAAALHAAPRAKRIECWLTRQSAQKSARIVMLVERLSGT